MMILMIMMMSEDSKCRPRFVDHICCADDNMHGVPFIMQCSWQMHHATDIVLEVVHIIMKQVDRADHPKHHCEASVHSDSE